MEGLVVSAFSLVVGVGWLGAEAELSGIHRHSCLATQNLPAGPLADKG